MQFENPYWAVLFPVCVAVAWKWPALQWTRPLRAGALALLALALMHPMVRVRSGGIELWVLMDRSASAESLEARQGNEVLSLLRRSKPAGAQLRVADFAAEVRERESEKQELRNTQSSVAEALRWVMQRRTLGRPVRMLLVSDGYSTDSVSGLEQELQQAGIPLDVRWLIESVEPDSQVDSVEGPVRVGTREPFFIQSRISSNRDGAVGFEILRDGSRVSTGKARVEKGRAMVRFTDRLINPGAHRYEVRILDADARAENNGGEAWVQVVGVPGVLLLSSFEPDPVQSFLEENGLPVRRVADPLKLVAGDLAGVRLVVLNNISSDRLSQSFRRALPFFVKEQGGGLMMLGGRTSFGGGGYYASEIDPLLPVSMDLRETQKRFTTAIAVLMDRSGSMGASAVGGGGFTGGALRKMDLANEGAARTVELMSQGDFVSVHAVDTTAHCIVSMTQLGPVRKGLINSVRSVDVGGGGIFVDVALEAAADELAKVVEVAARHVILFSDACDSEQKDEGKYRNLVQKLASEGVTVSVIGMGNDGDVHAPLLREIAELGRGRAFFQADPFAIPALFAQETMTVARPSFSEKPEDLTATAGWREVSAGALEWPARVDGFNVTIPRPGATIAAHTAGEGGERVPLVSFWHRGSGRVAAVGMPMAGPHSESVRAWPGGASMLAGLARWAASPEHPPGASVDARVRGTELEVDFYYEDSWNARVSSGPPRLRLSGAAVEAVRDGVWERMAPGHFRARVPLQPGEKVSGAVQIDKVSMPFGPLAVSSSAEWRRNPEALAEVRALSVATGGRERADVAGAWEIPPGASRSVSLLKAVLAVLALVLVLEALQTRIGGSSGRSFGNG